MEKSEGEEESAKGPEHCIKGSINGQENFVKHFPLPPLEFRSREAWRLFAFVWPF
jgi:hypothetical protein